MPFVEQPNLVFGKSATAPFVFYQDQQEASNYQVKSSSGGVANMTGYSLEMLVLTSEFNPSVLASYSTLNGYLNWLNASIGLMQFIVADAAVPPNEGEFYFIMRVVLSHVPTELAHGPCIIKSAIPALFSV